MRYPSTHKAETRRKIVRDASRRIRTQGLSGAAVSAIMSGTGLTHGGFYKHFESKDELLAESLTQAFDEIAGHLAQLAQDSAPGSAWKVIVRAYLSPEHCDHAEYGCPVAALAPELARAPKLLKVRILRELTCYRNRLLSFMPGRRTAEKERNFRIIFSTMLGAVAIARILPDPRSRATVLSNARDFLLHSF